MAHLEGDDPRHVGLPGQHHEIDHQLEVIREDFRGADGASDGQLGIALLLRELHAPLDIADSLQILVDLGAVRSTDPDAQPFDLRVDGIKDTAAFLSESQPCLRIGTGVRTEAVTVLKLRKEWSGA